MTLNTLVDDGVAIENVAELSQGVVQMRSFPMLAFLLSIFPPFV